MPAGWKTLAIQNSSLNVDLSDDEHVDDRQRDYWKDTVMRPKKFIHWPNLMTRRRLWHDKSNLAPFMVMVSVRPSQCSTAGLLLCEPTGKLPTARVRSVRRKLSFFFFCNYKIPYVIISFS